MAAGLDPKRTLLPIGLAILATFNMLTAIALDDIEGMIRGPDGGEAGVWVIAETTDLETTFRKIVVTGDDGRFLIPDPVSYTHLRAHET